MKDAEVKERVFEAADALYAEGGGKKIPTVHEVRARARTDMNPTSRLMNEWRAERDRNAWSPTVEEIPEHLVRTGKAALQSCWQVAHQIARDEHAAERAEWEAEHERGASLLSEVSTAYDSQSAELRAAQEREGVLEAVLRERELELRGVREQLALEVERTKEAASRTREAQARTAGLDAEVNRLHEVLAQERAKRADEVSALIDSLTRLSMQLNEFIGSETQSRSPTRRRKQRNGVTTTAVSNGDHQNDEQQRLV